MKLAALAICTIALFISCTENKKAEKDKEPAVTTTTISETEEQPDPTEYFFPGPMHKWLASFTGDWEADVISYMDPTKPDTSNSLKHIP
jgi:hypothetical protein